MAKLTSEQIVEMPAEVHAALVHATSYLAKVQELFAGEHDVAHLSEAQKARVQVLGACVSIALQHAYAILALTSRGDVMASAFALFRPLIDTFARGNYIARFGGDVSDPGSCIARFMRGEKALPRFENLLAELDKSHSTGMFSRFGGDFWSRCCDLTHTGRLQIGLNIQRSGTIALDFPEDQIATLVRTTAAIAAVAVGMFFLQIEDEPTAWKVVEVQTFAARSP